MSSLFLGNDERQSLFAEICGRLRFNFLVLAVTMDASGSPGDDATDVFLANVVKEWNRVFGESERRLKVEVNETELDQASTIEEAYLLALAAGAQNSTFVDVKLNVFERVSEFFGETNRGAIKSATTSRIVDKTRYSRLRSYCRERVAMGRVH